MSVIPPERLDAAAEVLAEATIALYTRGTPAEAAARSVGVRTGRVSLEDMTEQITQLRARAVNPTSAGSTAPGGQPSQRRTTRKTA